MKTALTRKEALTEGFTKCGRPQQDWQSIQNIEDLNDEDFVDTKWVLADKVENHPCISDDYLKDLLSDQIGERHADETGCDTDDVYDIVRAIDFKPFTKVINEALSSYSYSWMTEIELLS